MAQAQRDLEKAQVDLQHAYWEWACFTAQQAAEKGVKAWLMRRGYSVRGHSITSLLRAGREENWSSPITSLSLHSCSTVTISQLGTQTAFRKGSRPTITAWRKPKGRSMRRERSSGTAKISWIERDELLARLRENAEALRAARPEVADVRVFGSIARGEQTGDSDVDVLVVVSDNPRGPELLERISDYLTYFDLPIGVDLLVCSEERAKQAADGAAVFGLRSGETALVWRAADAN
jgi:predicted nucleotidyltransferase